MTKRSVVSDIAKVFDTLGLFSPATVKMKILLQRLWEVRLDWDDPVPEDLLGVWAQWRSELHLLSDIHIPRCYSPNGFSVSDVQLHGYCDASEQAYGGVVYLRLTGSAGNVHTEIVVAKTKVSPIKRLSIPRLELCGAQLLTKLLCHIKRILDVPVTSVFAWTDSTIVLSWLTGNPRRFKAYVGNRISFIIDLLPPDRWRHVAGTENPADCASRGLFPQQLKGHDLWWKGPPWLQHDSQHWPVQTSLPPETVPEEERGICHLTTIDPVDPIIPIARYSSFGKLERVTAWIFRFVKNLTSSIPQRCLSPHLLVTELSSAENYWLMVTQKENFPNEYCALKNGQPISRTSRLLPFRPIWDSDHSLIRVGGRLSNSSLSRAQQHPVILDGKHPITKLIITFEHLRLMHAGPTLLLSTLNRRFHIVKARSVVRSITRQCIICKRHSIHPQSQLLAQLPSERVSIAAPFERTGVDYAGPFQIKYGHVRKPTVVKTYICLFVCLTVKVIHLEAVSDLTTEAFIAALRRFVARRGCPALIWSDHGSNFVGAKSELKELQRFITDPTTQSTVSDYCSAHNIQWKFIPERAPHFGGIWESAVKGVKTHLKRIVSPVRLTFEEFTTVLCQIEACLNSRPLIPMNSPDDDGITVLTPGHFLIGKPLTAIPDPQLSYRSISLLKRWHLCQQLARHFWERWQYEYLHTLNKYNKWRFPSRNVVVGDIVILQESGTIPTKWPIARIIDVHPGSDQLIRVVTVRTSQGTYKRPVTKVAVLIPNENNSA